MNLQVPTTNLNKIHIFGEKENSVKSLRHENYISSITNPICLRKLLSIIQVTTNKFELSVLFVRKCNLNLKVITRAVFQKIADLSEKWIQ